MPNLSADIAAHPFTWALLIALLWTATLSPLLAVCAVWLHLRYLRRIARALESSAPGTSAAAPAVIHCAPAVPRAAETRIAYSAFGR
jgi:hypothetical protein